MKIKVNLSVGDSIVKDDVIDIDDWKLEELTEEEIEGTIEIQIRNWADQWIRVAWEVEQVKEIEE